ncbi:hypothetical protein [Scytonema hofmannii]|nr:hypothetical protein [Scytonema hofmannii]
MNQLTVELPSNISIEEARLVLSGKPCSRYGQLITDCTSFKPYLNRLS